MISEGINPMPIASERAFVVYDGKSGAIVHVHRVTTFAGAKDSSAKADRTRALSLAQQFGCTAEGLKVVAVELDDLPNAHRVDTKTGRLVCER